MEILLVDELAPEAHEWLAERHSVEYRPELAKNPSALRKAIYNVRALLLPRKLPVNREFLDFAPLLNAVARLHVAADDTDLEACRDRRVRVIQPSMASVRSSAEYLLGALLLLLRQGIGLSFAGERQVPPLIGHELHGSVVGILGLAPSAHVLTGMLAALGVRMIGYDPAVHYSAPIWQRLNVQPVSARELVSHADAVCVTVLYASRYRGMIDEKLLAHCKQGQVWVGTTPSSLFDAQALSEALQDGRIEACMLDGAQEGFVAKDSPLHQVENLYLTPRLGAHTHQARLRASWYVAHRVHETLIMPRNTPFDQIVSAPTPL